MKDNEKDRWKRQRKRERKREKEKKRERKSELGKRDERDLRREHGDKKERVC